MSITKWNALRPMTANRARPYSPAISVLLAFIQVVRLYWWWVPLLLLSMLAGSAVAAHHNQEPPSEVKPTLLVEKNHTPLILPA
ncbi:MAG: hypothetical protein EOO60_00125 [Hymenobacter sp.]|nr:MAG: hypothetical protein EOO60_00125 [Hymenobacter sp.]